MLLSAKCLTNSEQICYFYSDVFCIGESELEQEVYKILVADDSLFNREMLRRMLVPDDQSPFVQSNMQCDVITAVSGLDALEKAVSEKPDLILLDVIMPGMNGFEVLAQLQELENMKTIPVIFISGLTAEEDEEKGLLLGAVDYIAKPFKKAIVMARIKTHLKIVEQMRLIERLSMIDSLTNIPNRRNFDKYMSNEWKRALREKNPISLLMVDVDNFKQFNDKHGHRQGDEVLRKVAAELTSVLKRPADLAARWGGEEFAVLLPNTELEGAGFVAEQIRMKTESTAVPNISGKGDGPPLSVTISVGVATTYPTNEKTIAELVEQADKALYDAKKAGRNRVCLFEDTILERV